MCANGCRTDFFQPRLVSPACARESNLASRKAKDRLRRRGLLFAKIFSKGEPRQGDLDQGELDQGELDQGAPQTEALNLDALEARIGYKFKNPALLLQAVTHKSWTAEYPRQPNYERLEFLGDAVLQLSVTDYIHKMYPSMEEGQLSKLRSSVVSAEPLQQVADEIKLFNWIRELGLPEARKRHSSVAGDAVEALIGAIYIDGGWDEANAAVLRLFRKRIAAAARTPGGKDSKSLLQELVAKEGRPVYRTTQLEAGENPLFKAEVSLYGDFLGSGEGRSKKKAEQEAASSALEKLGNS